MNIFTFCSEAYAGVASVWAIDSNLRDCMVTLVDLGLLLWLAGEIWNIESKLWNLASTMVCRVAAVLVGIGAVLTSINVAGVLLTQISRERHALSLSVHQTDSNMRAFGRRESAGYREVRAQSAESLSQIGAGV